MNYNNSKKYEVRYHSDMIQGMALFGEYPTIAEAREWSMWLSRSFAKHGLMRESKSVQVC